MKKNGVPVLNVGPFRNELEKIIFLQEFVKNLKEKINEIEL